jgi:hypothetical protein
MNSLISVSTCFIELEVLSERFMPVEAQPPRKAVVASRIMLIKSAECFLSFMVFSFDYVLVVKL